MRKVSKKQRRALRAMAKLPMAKYSLREHVQRIGRAMELPLRTRYGARQ